MLFWGFRSGLWICLRSRFDVPGENHSMNPLQLRAQGALRHQGGSGWCRSFACSMGNTEKKDYIYLKTIASRKISWLIIRFSIKIAIRLGAPCAQPPLVFANFRRRAKIATLESAPLLHPRNGSDLWITSERKRSIIVKGICVQGF